jgi:hypothetical protein
LWWRIGNPQAFNLKLIRIPYADFNEINNEYLKNKIYE